MPPAPRPGRWISRPKARVLPQGGAQSPATMLSRLLKSAALHRAAAAVTGFYLEWALRSTRWTVEGACHLAPFLADGAVIVACWHERLPLAPAFWLPARRNHPDRQIATLASRHRDGRLIAAVMARFGVRAVLGSSGRAKPGAGPAQDRGGAAGLRALLAALKQGQAVVITPDGPRGPRRAAAPGLGLLASLGQAPVVPLAGQTRRRVTLRSWDRMVLPLPFGRGALVCLPPLTLAPGQSVAGLEAALTQAADRADALCR